MSEPSAWMREPYAASAVSSASHRSGSSSGGVAMSASANTMRSPVGLEHPRADGRALAAVRDGEQLELAVRGLRSGADERRGAVG